MTTTTTTTRYTAHGSGLSFRGLLVSEWIKLTSLRSTVWCYVIMSTLNIGLGVLLAISFQQRPDATALLDQGYWVQSATIAIAFSQLVVSVLGALVITGEYGTGMIRSTLTAVPKRLSALFSKAMVFGVVTFAVSLASIITAAFLAQLILNSRGLNIDLADGRAWSALTGGAVFLTLAGLIALFLGTIVRNSAGGISAALGLIIVAPIVVQIFAAVTRASWAQNVLEFLPSSAGTRMYGYVATPAPNIPDVVVVDPAQGLLVMIAWVLFFGIIASLLLKRRDA
ncbi:ABC transporter permease [Frigoribacterium sp. CG_9.8]|uniref:ABC transporter permease n=1 Tax=Frigoribacterium sp. CG_9.8 TaxID=2787733 RepID=UPI0018C90EA1|nr:ABC transporter permease [Frigoribacterium sp. CG_9.8]MBG6107184.1 ABC-2 type transport system permease protein [Frigoribacterium sp. CG_9.8]